MTLLGENYRINNTDPVVFSNSNNSKKPHFQFIVKYFYVNLFTTEEQMLCLITD